MSPHTNELAGAMSVCKFVSCTFLSSMLLSDKISKTMHAAMNYRGQPASRGWYIYQTKRKAVSLKQPEAREQRLHADGGKWSSMVRDKAHLPDRRKSVPLKLQARLQQESHVQTVWLWNSRRPGKPCVADLCPRKLSILLAYSYLVSTGQQAKWALG